MSHEKLEVLENDLLSIEAKTKEVISHFENQIFALVDKINDLEKILNEKNVEIENLKVANGNLLEEKSSLINEKSNIINITNHDRMQGIINNIEMAMNTDMLSMLNSNANSNYTENVAVNTQESVENFNSLQTTHTDNTESNAALIEESVDKIENTNISDVVKVDENEDPFSSASDDDWDNDISSNNPADNFVAEDNDSYNQNSSDEDEYILNEDDTDSFLFED